MHRGEFMNLRVPLLLFLLLLGAPAHAQDELAAKADAKAHEISDAEEFVQGLKRSLKMARRGDYGRIEKDDLKKVGRATDEIAGLLEGHERATELDTDDRIQLYNAAQLISSILRNDDKNRKVCRRESEAGSRLPKTVCMTVAERESRAEKARYETREIQKKNCRPGPGGAC
jgi:hypothetical protein